MKDHNEHFEHLYLNKTGNKKQKQHLNELLFLLFIFLLHN